MCLDHSPRQPWRSQRGLVTVELAICMTVFLVMVFGTLELARLMYVINTVQEVTRQAARDAAMTDFTNADALAAVKTRALFGYAALPLAPNLTTAQLRIDYLSMKGDGTVADLTAKPASLQANARECAHDPYGGTCVRAVRARICRTAEGTCDPVMFDPITGLIPGLSVIPIPISTTVVKAESLGFRPCTFPCN